MGYNAGMRSKPKGWGIGKVALYAAFAIGFSVWLNRAFPAVPAVVFAVAFAALLVWLDRFDFGFEPDR